MSLVSRRNSLTQGMALNWLSLGVNFATAFVVTPVVISRLGKTGYGMWALILSFSGYYGLLNLGINSALQRTLGRDLATDNLASLATTLATARGFFLGTSTLILAVLAIWGTPVAAFFGVAEGEIGAFSLTLLLCGLAVVLDFFTSTGSALFTAAERFDILNILGLCRSAAQTGGVLLVLWLHPSLNLLGLVLCAVAALTLITQVLITRALLPALRVRLRDARWTRLRELLHYGSSTVLLRVSNLVRLRVGNMIVARTAGLAAVAQFSIATNLIVNLNSVFDATLRVLTPRFTRLDAKAQSDEMRRLYRSALFCSSLMAGAMVVAIMLFSERFILFWVGSEFLLSATLLKILGLAFAVAFAQSPQWNLMLATAKHHFMSRVTVAESVAVLGLGLWLSVDHGALGFTWGTAIAMLVTKLTVTPIYGARIAQLRLSRYLEPMLWPVLLAGLFCAAGLGLDLPGVLRTRGVPLFLITLGLVLGAYLVAAVLLATRHDYMPDVVLRRLPFLNRLRPLKNSRPTPLNPDTTAPAPANPGTPTPSI